MNVILLGYMTSGKSVIAKELAKKTVGKFIDLDGYIELKEGLKISKIFKKKGEIYFRKIENYYLKEVLRKNNSIILSTGGGTPCYANNMKVILENGIVIYLKASIDTIYNRIILEKDKRPLVKDIPNQKLKEFIAKHLFERTGFYNQSNFSVSVDDKSVTEIVLEIVYMLNIKK